MENQDSIKIKIFMWFLQREVILTNDICESATNPRVVLVINNNIYIIELMPTQRIFQESSMIGMAIGCEGWTPQNAKDMDWQSFKTLHFWLSDPRSHWVHRKANTIKRGWGFDYDSIAQSA